MCASTQMKLVSLDTFPNLPPRFWHFPSSSEKSSFEGARPEPRSREGSNMRRSFGSPSEGKTRNPFWHYLEICPTWNHLQPELNALVLNTITDDFYFLKKPSLAVAFRNLLLYVLISNTITDDFYFEKWDGHIGQWTKEPIFLGLKSFYVHHFDNRT